MTRITVPSCWIESIDIISWLSGKGYTYVQRECIGGETVCTVMVLEDLTTTQQSTLKTDMENELRPEDVVFSVV